MKAENYKSKDYWSEAICARHLGCDVATVSRAAARGDYGKVYRGGGRLYISVKRLQRQAKRVFLFDPKDPIS